MLVLTRKAGEEVVIDGHIRITITAVNGDRVKVGVTAPRDVPVNRGEVAARIAAEEAADTVLIAACR